MTDKDQQAALGQILQDYKAAQQRRISLRENAQKMTEQLTLLASGIGGKNPITVTENDILVQRSSEPRQEVIVVPTKEEIIELIRQRNEAQETYEELRSQWDAIKPIDSE